MEKNVEQNMKYNSDYVAKSCETTELFQKSFKSGFSGANAMAIQVITLMWLRTAVNYQYRYGVSTTQAFRTLYTQGGITRFYRGLSPALLQAPLSRFGDTAANEAVTVFFANNKDTKIPISVQTGLASLTAGLWRMVLTPLDMTKTTLQVEGKNGINIIKNKVHKNGFKVMYHGSFASAGATTIGHYPWFVTHNYLDNYIPKYDDTKKKFARNALIGFCASFVSDTTSNSVRVLKTYKQTHPEGISYVNCAKNIVKDDGILSLFGRGLKTKILTNGIQGMMFNVLWKYFSGK